ncbi:MAG: 30S ribosomal protein S8 [Nitrospinota bacterium]
MTDPIADMLTRIRNAARARRDTVEVPGSRIKERIAGILHREGYIRGYAVEADGKQGKLLIELKRTDRGEDAIRGLKRVSRPGRRVYVGRGEIPRVMNGLGVAILTTSQGILTDEECRRRSVGGEVLCFVW